jgi:hypothetical protein
VRAASVNARDWHIMRGEPRLARLADRDTFGLRGRDLGADRVLDYTVEDFTRTGRTYEVVVDLAENRHLRDLRRVAGPAGSLVLSGGGVSGHGRLVGPMRLLLWSQISGRLTNTPIHVPGPDRPPTRRAHSLIR